MPEKTPAELLGKILSIVAQVGWRNNLSALEELKSYWDGDHFHTHFEFFGVHLGTSVARQTSDLTIGEVVLETAPLPYRAIIVRDSTGGWKLREFLAQCTGLRPSQVFSDRANQDDL